VELQKRPWDLAGVKPFFSHFRVDHPSYPMKTFRFLLLLAIVSCAAPKSFRPLTSDEQNAIRNAKKQIKTNDGSYHVLIMTSMGDMVVRLYNETPLHRDNFVSKVKSGFYDSLLFHRVINNFMIQGGDPTSKLAEAGTPLGRGSAPGDRIAAEFRTEQHIYHKRGALAAARDNNPEKASSNCQFYIVQRKPWRTSQLDSTIVSRKLTLNQEQRDLYTSSGGTPHLDGGYTVFGELESGIEVLDKIAATETDKADRPKADVRMKMFLLNEIRNP
jgi:peptidyl-prolyl cis-trans isomerase B (cyclophilin B)